MIKPQKDTRDRSTMWAVNTHGTVVSMPMYHWEGGLNAMGQPKGRKYQYGWRAATDEEVQLELKKIEAAKTKLADKAVAKIKIVNDEPVSDVEFSYAELKVMAKKKGMKVWGIKKEDLAKQLGVA